ncbi:MAG: hypothetical protein NTX33_00280 [Propionibacteriales bacterium]|nr:hypothetical protein [Propionibacteriales bacterium]
MSKIWLLRGCAAAVLAVLVGAWALGVANGGDSSSPKKEAGDPAPADTSSVASDEPSAVETTEPEGASTTDATEDTTEDAVDEPTPDTVESPGEVAGIVETQTPSAKPKPRPASQTPKPSNTPTPTPSQPADECTDLAHVLDCVLAPITTKP